MCFSIRTPPPGITSAKRKRDVVSRWDQKLPSTRCLNRDLCWEWGFPSVPSSGRHGEKTKWPNRLRQQPAFQAEWQWHLSQLVSELSVPTRLSPPPSPYHWLATDLKARLPSPSEMMHCAGGVIIEENILWNALCEWSREKGAGFFTFSLRLLG